MKVLVLYGSAKLVNRFNRAGLEVLGFFPDPKILARRTADNLPQDAEGFVECTLHPGVDFGDCPCIGADQFRDDCGERDMIVAAAADEAGCIEVARVVHELQPEWVMLDRATFLKLGAGDAD